MQPYMHRVGDSLIDKGTLAPNRSAAEAQDYHTDTRTALYISEKIIEKVAINQTRTDKHSFIAHDNTSHIHNVCIRICMYIYIYIVFTAIYIIIDYDIVYKEMRQLPAGLGLDPCGIGSRCAVLDGCCKC